MVIYIICVMEGRTADNSCHVHLKECLLLLFFVVRYDEEKKVFTVTVMIADHI